MNDRIIGALDEIVARLAAIGGLSGLALIHVLQLPDAFAGIGYLGVLFVLVIVASLGLAALMVRGSDQMVWTATAILPALVLLGYLISRITGLPGFTDDMGEWSEPLGLASMVCEGLLVVVSATVLASSAARRSAAPATRRDPASHITAMG
jgi:hypothetical protein